MAESDIPATQWPVILDQKCELCDINPISFKCLNCDEMVCDHCKNTHLKSKSGKGHKVVCLKSAEIYERYQTGKKCPSHTKEELLMYCNTCDCPICRECVTSGVHLNHPMVKVEEVIDIKEKQLSDVINQANEKSKKYKDVLETILQSKLEFSMSIAKKIDMVKSRNKELKEKLDKIESNYIKVLQNTDKENKKAMSELEQKLQGKMSNLNNLIQQCELKYRDRNIEMIQFVSDITQRLVKYTPCDLPDVACLPDLITRHVNDQELEDLFGYLTNTIPEVNPPLSQNSDIPLASPAIDVKIVSSFPSKKSNVVTTGNNQALLWSPGDKGISLVTSDGKVVQDINTDFEVFGVAASPTGDLFLTMLNHDKVKKLTGHNTFTDIYAADGYITQGITVTDLGNVLVLLYKYKDSKMVEITTSGQHIRTIQRDTMDNKLLFKYPLSVCTNINGDIIVVDGYNKAVVAVNKSGTKRFIYDGKERKLPSFTPRIAVTDKHGHIIISDFNNSVLHVLDRDGKFIQYLLKHEQGCDSPVGIAVDSSGTLWVCNTGNETISVMKYV